MASLFTQDHSILKTRPNVFTDLQTAKGGGFFPGFFENAFAPAVSPLMLRA
jgi:hypothetical protein